MPEAVPFCCAAPDAGTSESSKRIASAMCTEALGCLPPAQLQARTQRLPALRTQMEHAAAQRWRTLRALQIPTQRAQQLLAMRRQQQLRRLRRFVYAPQCLPALRCCIRCSSFANRSRACICTCNACIFVCCSCCAARRSICHWCTCSHRTTRLRMWVRLTLPTRRKKERKQKTRLTACLVPRVRIATSSSNLAVALAMDSLCVARVAGVHLQQMRLQSRCRRQPNY